MTPQLPSSRGIDSVDEYWLRYFKRRAQDQTLETLWMELGTRSLPLLNATPDIIVRISPTSANYSRGQTIRIERSLTIKLRQVW